VVAHWTSMPLSDQHGVDITLRVGAPAERLVDMLVS
jgi:hypothetical protein